MKYCPYCGARYTDGTVFLCPACGKQFPIPEQLTSMYEKKQRQRKKDKANGCRESTDLSEITDKHRETGYDGYYDDILPPDWDQIKDGIDKVLARNIIVLIASVILIIIMCVALLYVL